MLPFVGMCCRVCLYATRCRVLPCVADCMRCVGVCRRATSRLSGVCLSCVADCMRCVGVCRRATSRLSGVCLSCVADCLWCVADYAVCWRV